MTQVLPNKKKSRNLLEAERIAISQGVRPFSFDDAVQDPTITDDEIEEFLRWRNESRKADVEAQKECLP